MALHAFKYPISKPGQRRQGGVPEQGQFIAHLLKSLHVRPPFHLITIQPRLTEVPGREAVLDHLGQNHRILDRLVAALGHMRVHGMRGIPDQGDSIGRPSLRPDPHAGHVAHLIPSGDGLKRSGQCGINR